MLVSQSLFLKNPIVNIDAATVNERTIYTLGFEEFAIVPAGDLSDFCGGELEIQDDRIIRRCDARMATRYLQQPDGLRLERRCL